MRRKYTYSISRLLLPLLFVGYVLTSTFFTHFHIKNNTIYVHNHPYKKSDPLKHSHNSGDMIGLDLIAHTPFLEEIVAVYDFAPRQPLLMLCVQLKSFHIAYFEKSQTILLRAPPAAISIFTF